MDVIDDAVVLDLFAGSGAMGIEALSRGARRCTFIERERRALEIIRGNVTQLGLESRSTVIAGDVATSVVAQRGVTLALVDPPYDFDRWGELLGLIAVALEPGAVVVAESGRELAMPSGWRTLRSKRYGRTWVAFLQQEETERKSPANGTVTN